MTTTYQLIESRADYQVQEIALLTSINNALTVTGIPVTDPIADALLASIDSKTIHVDTNNTVITSSVLPTGASTLAEQQSQTTFLSSLDSKFNSLGQKTMSQSSPVVIASNQSALPVSQSGTWTVNLAMESIEIGTVDQGIPAAIGNAWPTKITDGVDILEINAGGEALVTATQSGIWTVQPGNTANTTPWLSSTKTALTPASPTAATVGVTTALAVAANASRKGLTLVNTSNNTISLGFGVAAVLSSGITLGPFGSWVMTEYTFTTAAINAIASGASSNLSIQEYS